MPPPEALRYLVPSQTAGKRFLQRDIAGLIVMLNLLRFRDVADYSAHPELAPPVPIAAVSATARPRGRTPGFFR